MAIQILTNLESTGALNLLNINAASLSSGYISATNVFVDGNIGIGIIPTEKLHVDGNVLITGNLSALGTATYLDTEITNTNTLDILNDGSGPALKVTQTGNAPIAAFYDENNLVSLFVDGHNTRPGHRIGRQRESSCRTKLRQRHGD